jgi:hypothetical protein
MSWAIAFGAPDPALGLDIDGQGWVWHLERCEDSCDVTVIVTGQAGSTDEGQEAAASEGELLVRDVLGWSEPPDRIVFTVDRGVVYDGGSQ